VLASSWEINRPAADRLIIGEVDIEYFIVAEQESRSIQESLFAATASSAAWTINCRRARVGFVESPWSDRRSARMLEQAAFAQAVEWYRGAMPTAYWEPTPDEYPRIFLR
jgi:hypothetical protein